MNPGGPGWNDPPSLSYQTHTQTTSRRNILNKRIGLPDLKVPDKSVSNAVLTGPPPLGGEYPPAVRPSHSKVINTTLVPTCEDGLFKAKSREPVKIFNPFETPKSQDSENIESNIEETEENETEILDIDIVKELKLVVRNCEDSEIFPEQVSVMIKKKLDIISYQLQEGVLSVIVKQKMAKLTHYLMTGRHSKAWEVHVELMCDHPSSVVQWMAGVKRLISEAKKLE